MSVVAGEGGEGAFRRPVATHGGSGWGATFWLRTTLPPTVPPTGLSERCLRGSALHFLLVARVLLVYGNVLILTSCSANLLSSLNPTGSFL